MKISLKILRRISIKTIYFNFKYLPLKQAIKLPIFVSKNLILQKTAGKVVLEGPIKTGLVRIGFGDTGIFDFKRSRGVWNVDGTVIFKGKTRIGHGSKISVDKDGTLTLGKNFEVTAESTIVAYSEVSFGENCLLSWDILVMDTDLHKIKNSSGDILNAPRPIFIGNNVWIGCRCLILKGASIPNGSIIGANSTISKKLVSERSIYRGNPAECSREDITWEM